MSDHDPMCRYRDDGLGRGVSHKCQCALIARVRADERAKIIQQWGGVNEYVMQMLRMIDALTRRVELAEARIARGNR